MTENFCAWRKSRHSQPNGGCVEAGRSANGAIGVRDTKLHGRGSTLEFTRDEWQRYLQKIRADGPDPTEHQRP